MVARLISLLILVATLLGVGASSAFAANSAPAMIVPGQFNVSDTGAFTYKIPIATPPGTAGMEPTLSLDYSSQGGDGTLGWDWTLSGIPSIGRCPRTYAQDGVHGAVNYDANDRFCMEGQRLVAISGTYGADGTIYRTEIEGFSQITSHGTAGTGPSYFTVQTKSGQTIEFGNTTDSKIFAQGKTTVRTWGADRITDVTGNYLSITYTNDTTNGQAYPIEIDYTGNTAAGLTPFSSVQFVYNTSRLYPATSYQAGSMVKTTVLLTDVKTYTGLASGGSATLVNDYRLAYTPPGSAAAHYELTSVTQCDAATGGNCLKPTSFGWQGSKDTLTLNAVANSVTQGGTVGPGYFQGSGLTDFVTSSINVNCGVYFGTATGFSSSSLYANYLEWIKDGGTYTSTPYDGPLCKWNGFTGFKNYVDFNGDGLTDVLLNQAVAANHLQTFQLLNSGTALNQVSYPPGYPLDPPALYLADFNGDGRTDILVSTGSGYSAEFSNGDGTFGAGFIVTTSAGVTPADFDGDGCADILEQGAANQVLLSCNPAVASFSAPNFTGSEVVLGDFNGDGLTDILVAPASGAATLYLSTGTGLATAITLSGFTDWGKYLIYTGDWNGDGKTDIFLVASGLPGDYGVGTSHKFYLSTGAGFNAGPTVANTNSMDTNVSATVADWNNDGAADIWLQKASGDTEELFSYVPEEMNTVSNGLGVTTTVTYAPLNTNGSLYQKCTTAGTFVCGAAYPTLSLDGPIYVVSAISSSNGIGGTYNSTYAYQAAQVDLHGRGFLGFAQMAVTDSQTGVVQTTSYGQAFPYTGIITAKTTVSGSVTVNAQTNTYGEVSLGTGTDGVARYFVELQKTVVVANDLNGAAMPTVTTTYAYDCDSGSACAGTSPTGYGNALSIAVSLSDGSSKTTTNTFANDTTYGHWYLGRLLTANVQSIVGSSNLTRQTSYTYDTGASTSTGLLLSEIVEPEASSDPTLKLETDYSYDAFGNRTVSAVKGCVWSSGCSITTRATQTQYDTTTYHGQFATQVTNALSQAETWSYAGNIAFGGPTSHTGPNGLTTSWAYDTFGRKTLETRPDGNTTAVAFAYCTTSSCPTLPPGLTLAQLPANVQFYVLTTPETSAGAQNGPIAVTFYDGLSRMVATDVEGFDGSGTGCTTSAPCWIRTATQYDANGRVGQTSRPYFVATGTPKWTVNAYDALGRVTLVTFPDSSTQATQYCGLSTSITNAMSVIKTTVNNAQGLPAQVYDLATATCGTTGAATRYSYDAFGDLLTVVDPAGNTVGNNSYDIRGRKTQSIDADMGNWTYVYDGFGELSSQTDAKGQISTLTYDALGRVLTRVEVGLSSAYVYDTASGKGVGQPATASASTGTAVWGAFTWGSATWSDGAYARAFAYDSLGRPSTLTLTEDGSAGVYTLTYDVNGRIQTVAYPSGFTAKYSYTTLGYLYQVSDNAVGTVFWTANSQDAELHLLSQTQGNGVAITQVFNPNTGLVETIQAGAGASVANESFTFDTLGRLTDRSWLNNSGGSVTENSCFDGLNRLTSTLLGPGTACAGAGAVTIAYDALGNITQKSDVCATAGCFAYGGSGAGPHALTSIAGTYNGVSNPTFAYDANGVMTAGAGRVVTATSFNMAALITDGANTAAFGYDPDHARYRMVSAGLNAGTTYYLNDPSSGGMEEQSIVSGVTTWRDYIMANGRMVAQRLCTGPPPCSASPQVEYFILDHLGSVAVIVNASGTVLNRLSYDAWGKRRNPDGSALSCTAGLSPPSSVTRGFTGQEMLDGLCLVNFNARIYDPSLGRFMSADPMVGDETLSQALNRYSYVLNDPLSVLDPSGMCGFWCIFRDVLAVAVAVILEQPESIEWLGNALEISGPYALAYGESQIIATGVAGGLAGLITTGTLKGAALGVLQAGLFDVVGGALELDSAQGVIGLGHSADVFIAHGLVGGLVSEIGTGRFGSGFLAGGISSFTPVPAGGQTVDETVEGAVESAALGGVGSVLGGGKFQDGAITGAFGYLFNESLHQKITNAQDCHGDFACEKAVYQSGYNQASRANWWLAIPALAPGAVASAVQLVGDFLLGVGEGVSADLSSFSNWDVSGGLKGINTNVNASEFSANLQANGYTATYQTGSNGPVTILQNGEGSSYTIYTRTSNGVVGVQYIGPNGQTLKFNLGK